MVPNTDDEFYEYVYTVVPNVVPYEPSNGTYLP